MLKVEIYSIHETKHFKIFILRWIDEFNHFPNGYFCFFSRKQRMVLGSHTIFH
jgi:hypothetical protein